MRLHAGKLTSTSDCKMGSLLSRAKSHVVAADLTLPPVATGPAITEAITPSGIRIVAMRTGWVGVKSTHRELEIPSFLAVPAIFLSRVWAQWMPIICYAIVHPSQGTVLVDAGPDADINNPDYYSCDPNNEFFYKRNLRFHVPDGEVLSQRLQQAGIAPQSIRKLVITHFHADHVGGVGCLPRDTTAFVGPGNWPSHLGAFTCRLPKGFSPVIADYKPQPAAGTSATTSHLDSIFPETHNLTTDGRVRIASAGPHSWALRSGSGRRREVVAVRW